MMDKLFDGSDAHLLPGNAELIERLNEPDAHYPGNFDTVKRANAILMCLCQEAADALEAADKRIAELERKLAVAREALRELACLGNGSRYGNSIGNNMAMKALAQIGEKNE